MQLQELRIGRLRVAVPIIQGAMAVRISTAPLAAAVANEGGIGMIAGTGMSLDDLRKEIRKARELSQGIIGVNVLFAVSEFASLVKGAIEEKIDLIISGAGFSRDMFAWGREGNVPIVPVVSSAKLACLAEKLGAAAVVVEGKEAGGHLGTNRPLREILPEVRAAVRIPVIGAGGVIDGQDLRAVLALGADGVQMGTRFAASDESNASDEFKAMYVQARHEDVVLINSPVGLPGRGLRNSFYQLIDTGGLTMDIEECTKCLKRCSRNFCLRDALANATRNGDFEKALVFAGEQVERIKEILPVHKIFENLLQGVRSDG
jgi:NAD(P)H-dependent flavin oxidoreductase YrpB (nitropropane dioxygenase family)